MVSSRLVGLGWGIAALMTAQAVLGLVLQGEYRDAAAWIRAAWFGNDWFTLLAVVPLLVAAVALARRGSPRALLLYLGVLLFSAYNYAYYLLGAALNAFYPLYVTLLLASLALLIVTITRVSVDDVAAAFAPRTPVRLVGGFLVVVGVGLAAVWLGTWARYVFAGATTPIEPEAFKLVASLDLMFAVPVLVTGGVLLWRRRPWGYLIATVASVEGALYLLLLAVNSGVMISRGLATAPGELPVWGVLCLVLAAAGAALLACVRSR